MQIGPRIRVGGSVGKVGQQLKVGAGKVMQKVSPLVGLINPALGAGMNVAGDALDTSEGKFNIGNAVKSGVASYAGGKLLNTIGSHIPAPDAVKRIGTSISDRVHVPDVLKRVGSRVGSGISDRVQGIMGAVPDKVKSGVTDMVHNVMGGGGGGVPDAGPSTLDKILMAGSVAAGTEDALHRRKLANQAGDYARGSYDSRAPLRQRALKLLENPAKPDLSDTFSDPGNVYDRPRRPLGGGVA